MATSPSRGGPPGADGAGGEARALPIGGEGKDMVHEILAASGPHGIAKVQEACLMPYPLVRHLLGMLESMEVTRVEAHRAVLARAKERLLSRVAALEPRADRSRLERLLAASFTYLGMAEMREVPLAAMERLERVPPPHLKQLAADTEIFKSLPPGVQRQVWEYDKNLLQNDAIPLVGAYKYETATYMRALAADEFLPALLADAARLAPAFAAPPSAAFIGPAGAKGGASGAGAYGGGNDPDSLAGLAGRGVGSATVPGRGAGAGGAGRRGGAGAAAAAAAAKVGGSHLLGGLGEGGGPGGGGVVGITRKILRKGSRITQALKGMVGSSPKIYLQIVELCAVRFVASDRLYLGVRECSYATLRGQLLMALHDDNNPLAAKDRCHELAWTLDAGIRNGCLSDKHLEKLGRFFEDILEAAEEAENLGSKRRRGASGALPGGSGRGRREPLDESESAGAGGHGGGAGGAAEPLRVLGDAALVLRDPSALHLLAAQVLSLMQSEVLLPERLPRDVPPLVLVLRLMQLAAECRNMLRERAYRFPDADRTILQDLLPVLAATSMDHHIAGVRAGMAAAKAAAAAGAGGGAGVSGGAAGGTGGGAVGGAAAGAPPAGPEPNAIVEEVELEFPDAATKARVYQALRSNEVARRLLQTYALERLAKEDYLAAAKVLSLLARLLAPGCLAVECADFASTLAARLAERVAARRLGPGCTLWTVAVDNLLVAAVDAHTQTHEEVLRLLLAAALPTADGRPPLLLPAEVDAYLRITLENSRDSRRKYKKFTGGDALARFPMASLLASDIGSDIGSDGWPGIMQLKLKGADGVRSVYEMFRRVPGISPENAPALFDYLNNTKL
ncbi:hypothetical protein GPECTOR_11g276 [Gonium pectorale]|uniref:Negative elongation factor B n=1 Tax=Gonium pectorale TaxID=33097 RepID=A0A150GPS5_GONPE|nr:hypothetical protein GPECTOR_11g276 [Gonium pectorale]|eukprot:KXZ51837.1 hypothetical protein GPECTOR_11g276 [Gonium pectorale]